MYLKSLIKKALAPVLAVSLVGCANSEPVTDEQTAILQFEMEEIVIEPEVQVVALEVVPSKYKYELPGASIQEQMALRAFQDRGITDRLALATLMGNLKQESLFKADICEGGARVPYEQCFSGGYGLIQWTTANRYRGLGEFCEKYDCNPSTTEGQLRYLFNEYQWIRSEHIFKTPGKSIEWYMENGAYPWLGWGIHGERTNYAYDYARWLSS